MTLCALLAATLSLNGAWEMAYSPYFLETDDYPTFSGKIVREAIPGYWEDLLPAFREAGITETFRLNPEYAERSLPAYGWAPDTQLPQPYGLFFYRRTVRLAAPHDGYLAFEGVRNDVRVWVNGAFVEHREGYSTPFRIDVPASFFREGANEIVLAVQNKLNVGYNGGEVRGITSRALFRATGGVSGNLELVFPEDGLRDIYVTTAKDLKTFTVHVEGPDAYDYEIGARRGRGRGDLTLPVGDLALWTPETPVLHTLVVRTKGAAHTLRFGLRRLAADGVKLRLNGAPVVLRGVTEHGYFPQTVHLPRDLDYYRMITRKRKELGFNFVRFHTFVPPVEYLQATDELGMMVHIESPNFVPEWEYAAIVAFARHHPSVVLYCTGNETRIDHIAEAYLRSIADLVHEGTDALFSPMSALRGVSYQLFKNVDPIVAKPFPHNAERARRLAEFCDVFTAYQRGATSYNYVDGPTAKEIDGGRDVYCGKPILSHEICIDGTYADLSLESMYPEDNPIRRTKLFSEVRRLLTEKGIVDRAPLYFTNSCRWVALNRKFCFEKARASEITAGYDFLGDINTHWHTFGYSVGMMDEFYRLKPGETPERVRMYNAPAVVLADFGRDFVFEAGSSHTVKFTLSDNGVLSSLGEARLVFPASETGCVYTVCKATMVRGVAVSNRWEVYAFPPSVSNPQHSTSARVVTDIARDDLLASLSKGERVLLLGTGPFKSAPMSYNAGRAGRCSGNFATVIKAHPALVGFPHEGFCGWQFRRLMGESTSAALHGRAVQLEGDVPFDPIIDVASAVKNPIRQAALFEYRVGAGRLMVCSFKFNDDDPAARYLKSLLVRYVASDAFQPPAHITLAQLASVIDAPQIRTTANPNRAANPGDPAGCWRVRAHAQP